MYVECIIKNALQILSYHPFPITPSPTIGKETQEGEKTQAGPLKRQLSVAAVFCACINTT